MLNLPSNKFGEFLMWFGFVHHFFAFMSIFLFGIFWHFWWFWRFWHFLIILNETWWEWSILQLFSRSIFMGKHSACKCIRLCYCFRLFLLIQKLMLFWHRIEYLIVAVFTWKPKWWSFTEKYEIWMQFLVYKEIYPKNWIAQFVIQLLSNMTK